MKKNAQQEIIDMGITGEGSAISQSSMRKREDGDLLFNELDIAAAADPLSRALRTIFFNRKTTMKEFRDIHNKWAAEHGFTAKGAGDYYNNTKKGLLRNKTTWDFFQWITLNILNINLIKLDFEEIVDGKRVNVITVNLGE